MNKISRKGFLKIAAAAAMSGVTAGALSACNSSSSSVAASGASVYTAGTYTATAKGMNDITVTMTFSDTAITEVKVDTANETLDLAVNSAADFQTMLMEAQSAEIDGVSGATVTSNAVKEAAADCIQQAMGLTGGAEDESTSYGDDPRGAARAAAKADGRVFGYSGPGDWLGEAPAFSSVDSEVDCDVCVVGLGHAGVAAVLGAAEKGAKVVGIESQTEDNFAWYGEDIGAWNSKFAQDAGIPAWDLGQICDEFVTRSGGRADPGIVSLYVQHSGETLDHMLDVCKEMGVDERMMSKVFKCDTLEELAKAMGVPDDKMDTFMASIDEYNAMCDAGKDDKFGKDASALIPIREAPFYGCAQTLGNRSASPSMVTMNGMMTDLNLNVLNIDYEPIKGLYAAGNSLGGRYGTGYSTPCAGNSIGMAVTHGRLAGQFCVDNV